MPTRPQRHSEILRVLRAERIRSQQDLREILARKGFEVTQATLSRDLRALGVVKATDEKGRPVYTVPADVVDPTPALERLLPTLYVGSDGVDNLLVVRTLTGGAQPVAVAIDHEGWSEVVGTLAGDDTILLIARSAAARARIHKRIEDLALSR